MAKKQSFEQSLTKLEELVAQLEKGDLSLEESMKLYEQGIVLTRSCSKELESAQLKIEELKAGKTDEAI